MLPRLILFTLLTLGGLQAISVAQRPNNLLGIRSFIDRLRVDSNSAVGAICKGVGCASGNKSQLEAKSLALKESDADDEDEKEKGMVENTEVTEQEQEHDEDDNDDGTAVEEGRGKKKKKYGKYLLTLAGFTKALMLYVMIHAVAAVAGKALIVAKVALAIAIALALKKHEHKTSYEIVKHPTYSHVQTHSSSVDYDHGSSGGSGGGGGGYEGSSRRRRRANAVYR